MITTDLTCLETPAIGSTVSEHAGPEINEREILTVTWGCFSYLLTTTSPPTRVIAIKGATLLCLARSLSQIVSSFMYTKSLFNANSTKAKYLLSANLFHHCSH